MTGNKYILKRERANINIPCAILNDRNVAVLEAITEYLKDVKKLTYHEIAVLLNRDDRTIWTGYYRAKRKRRRK